MSSSISTIPSDIIFGNPSVLEVLKKICRRERQRKGRHDRAVDEERVSLCKERLTGNLSGKIERSAEALRMSHHPISPLQVELPTQNG